MPYPNAKQEEWNWYYKILVKDGYTPEQLEIAKETWDFAWDAAQKQFNPFLRDLRRQLKTKELE